jgi:hypothetical protein
MGSRYLTQFTLSVVVEGFEMTVIIKVSFRAQREKSFFDLKHEAF